MSDAARLARLSFIVMDDKKTNKTFPTESRRFRVLFVCSANMQRSPTAEKIYRNDPRIEVRSAGVRVGARRRISENDLRWADVVFVMEREHKHAILSRFDFIPDFPFPPIEVLDIPDEFDFMQSALVEALKAAIDPELDHLLALRNGEKEN